jgi:hypothetical protein
MKRSLPRRKFFLRKEPTGSRVLLQMTKAMEGVKRLEMQPRGTQRRTGRGMLAQPSWEQERAVSAPAVRPVGCQLAGGLGAPSPINGIPVKWVRAERQSERPIAYRGSGVMPVDGKGPHLVCGFGEVSAGECPTG